ncbi:MAG: hypothetical protein ACI3XR_08075 [Eubacteriales bacterium]
MLIKATLEDIQKYGESVYNTALNPVRSSYPTYRDGIKTKSDFFCDAERAVKKDTSELLLFRMEGNVEGWISYFWIPKDKYLQLTACHINCGTAQALTELLDWLETHFAGYTAYFGFPGENREAMKFLQAHAFKCIEKDWNYSLFFDDYELKNGVSCVERITRRNFDKFRTVYHAEPETYWNCDRIYETLDDWIIHVYIRANMPVATAFLTGDKEHYEIFGIEFVNGVFQESMLRELLTASLNECKRLGAKYMTYFCKEEEKHILQELGFKGIGQYVLYIKEL